MRCCTLLLLLLLLSGNLFSQNDDGRQLTIQVVIHVIYTDSLTDNGMSDSVRNSDNGNNTTYLPKSRLLAELSDLDNDFLLKNTDVINVVDEYKNIVGNPNIHFALKDIRYTKADADLINMRDNRSKQRELSPPSDPENCLNIYISHLRISGGGSEGVTSVPTTNTFGDEDVVHLNYSWIGLHYRLLTHEVGHWLGLWHNFHTYQLTVDNITDIPVQTDFVDKKCEKCTRSRVKVIRRQRNLFRQPNTNNYMDYSGCRSMFSIQQCYYMRNLIFRLRKRIWDGAVL